MSAVAVPAAPEASRESRVRSLFRRLRASLSKAAAAPLDLSHTEQAIRDAERLRAELIAGNRDR